jgi:hypothetical protein
MSKIEDIYGAVVDVIEDNLTGYIRLPNPYAVEANTYLHLRKGFGVALGPGTDTERYTGCLVTWQRVFTIILVNQITTTPNNTAEREIIEKDLLDDHDVLRKKFYLDSTLGGKSIKATITDDQGIAFIDADRLKFLSIEMSLVVEYQEDPNS